MLLKAKRGSVRAAAVYVGVCALVWAALAGIFLALSFFAIVGFFAFNLLAVVIPGIAVFKLLGLRLSPLASLACSYALGMLADGVVYLIFAPFKLMSALPYALGALCLLALFYLIKTRSTPFCAETDEGELKLGYIFCSFALLATFFTLSAAMLDPELSGARSYFYDLLYGVSYAVSAAQGYPMQIMQMSGVESWYHLLYFSHCALMKLCTGLDAFTVVTKLSLVTISPLLAAAVVSLAKSVLKKTWLTAVACFAALVIPCASNVHSYYQDLIGYPLGIAFAVLSVLMFKKAREHEGTLNRYYIACSLLLVGSLAAKGPLAAPILFSLCFVLLMDLIRKRDMKVFARGLALAVPFIVCYLLLFRSEGAGGIGFHPTWDSTAAVNAVQSLSFLPQWLFRAAVCVNFSFSLYPSVSVMFGFCVLCMIFLRKNEELRALNEFCFSGTLLGLIIVNFVHQSGASELYFLTAMTPFLAINTVRVVYELVKAGKTKTLKIVAGCLCAAALLPCAVSDTRNAAMFYRSGGQENHVTALRAAIQYSRFSQEQPINMDYRRNTITRAEYEGMVWLRDNTPADSVIADGRYLPNNKYFAGGAFSERAFFLEGWGFTTDEDTNALTEEKVRRDTFLRYFFESGDEGYLPLLAREGCDYVIVSEFINPGLTLTDEYCSLVFENEDLHIYKLNEYDVY